MLKGALWGYCDKQYVKLTMGESLKGYFQFSVKDQGVYITVYPPKEGGKPASMEDVLYYIDKRNIDCDLIALKEAFRVQGNPVTVKVSDTEAIPCAEFGDYKISTDCMRVEGVFYPGFEGTENITSDEIVKNLQSIGVKYGIDNNAIEVFIREREYGKSYILGEGLKPEEGKDGHIEYKFDLELNSKPKMNEDGTVDFHTLENVNHIKVGDVVAIIVPEQQGAQGFDLFNRSIPSRKVKKVVFKHEKNLVVSEDGLSLITKVSGHVRLEGDKIFVSNVMELVDVDNSTGDIEYEGNVAIKGNVLAGFTVKATGDVSVSGIVEGATIISGGTITLNRGIQGMNRAVIEAKKDIITKFIESAESVVAGGSIETDTILHSKVIAKGAIIAKGKNGLIVGGDVKSGTLVDAKTIGNAMGTATVVGVGVNPSVKKRVDELKKSLDNLGNNKIQLDQLLTALRKKQEIDGKLEPEKQNMLQKTMRNLIILEQQLASEKREFEECRSQLNEDCNAKVKVQKTMNVGTKLVFGEQYLFLKEKYDYCEFMKVGADIKCMSL